MCGDFLSRTYWVRGEGSSSYLSKGSLSITMGSQSTQEKRTTGWAERGGWEENRKKSSDPSVLQNQGRFKEIIKLRLSSQCWTPDSSQVGRTAPNTRGGNSDVSSSSHQGWRVLVWPEGLWNGPVAHWNPRLWVWSHIYEFMAAVPGLRAERRHRSTGFHWVFYKTQHRSYTYSKNNKQTERKRLFFTEHYQTFKISHILCRWWATFAPANSRIYVPIKRPGCKNLLPCSVSEHHLLTFSYQRWIWPCLLKVDDDAALNLLDQWLQTLI